MSIEIIKPEALTVRGALTGSEFNIIYVPENNRLEKVLVSTPTDFNQSLFVFLEDFGAVGDGVIDDTTSILNAITEAKTKKKAIFLQSDKSYIFTPTSITDITGMTGIVGNGTIDCSNVVQYPGTPTPTSQNRLFSLIGGLTLLQNNVSTVKGNSSTILNTGLSINSGDTLFLYSLEASENAYKVDYFKGQRVVVDNYNTITGVLNIVGFFTDNITTSYLYHNSYQPKFELGRGVTLKAPSSDNQLVGIFGQYSYLSIYGDLLNFGHTALSCSSSYMYANYRAFNSNSTTTGNAYGCGVFDLSEAHLVECNIQVARHAVSTGGGDERQIIAGGGSGGAVYPCKTYINGGVFASAESTTAHAVDSHGNVDTLYISNANIYGGVTASARNFKISDSDVYYFRTNGYDTSIESISSSFGNHELINTNFTATENVQNSSTGIRVSNEINSLKIHNCTINDKPVSGVNAILINIEILKLDINGLNIVTSSIGSKPTISIYNDDCKLRGITTAGEGLNIVPMSVGRTIFIDDYIGKTGATGLFISSYGNKTKQVTLNNCRAENFGQMGIYVSPSERVYINNCTSINNGTDTGQSSALRVGVFADGVDKLLINGCDFSATNSLQQYAVYSGSDISYSFLNSFFEGNQVASKYLFSGYSLNLLSNIIDSNTTDRITTTAGSFDTVYTHTIPANTLEAGDILNIRVSGKDIATSGTKGIQIDLPSAGLVVTNPFYPGDASDFIADIEVEITTSTTFTYNSSVTINKIATAGENTRRVQGNGVSGLGFDIASSSDFIIKLNNATNGDLTIKTSSIKINR